MVKNLQSKILGFIALLFIAMVPSSLMAQNLDPLEEVIDLQAQTQSKVTTPEGTVCALIKVYTSIERSNLQFDTDMASTIERVDNSTMGQIWVYLSPGARQLTVRHSEFEESIAFARVVSGKVYKTKINYVSNIQYQQVVVNTSDYLSITSNAPMSSISINGGDEEPFNEFNTYSKSLEFGSYTFEISAPNYRPYRGQATINASTGKVQIDAELVANFVDLHIVTTPESDVMVSIDGVSRGVTPLTVSAVNYGTHKLRLQKSMYKIEEQTIEVGYGGGVQQVNVALTPTFIESTVTVADANAEIYMNGMMVGKGSYTGRIPLGSVTFEARKESHRTTYREQNIVAGTKPTIRLDAPTPIYGILRVEESAGIPDVAIVINGKNYGTAPSAISNILIGDYTVKLERNGYRTYEQNVTISETKPVEIRTRLEKYVTGPVAIQAHSGAKIYDGAVEIAQGSFNGQLPLGAHTIVVKDAFGEQSKSINVTPNTVASLIFESGNITIRSDVGDVVTANGKIVNSNWSGAVLAGNYTLSSRSTKGDVVNQSVTIAAGDNKTVSLQQYSTVKVLVAPDDAKVAASVTPVSRRGNTFTMKPGEVTFSASRSNYYDGSKSLNMLAGKEYSINMPLKRMPNYLERSADAYYEEMDSRDMGASICECAISATKDGTISSFALFNYRYKNFEFSLLGFESLDIESLMNFYPSGELYDKLLEDSLTENSDGDLTTTEMTYCCGVRYILPLASWLSVTGSMGGSFSRYTGYGVAAAGLRLKYSIFFIEGYYEQRGIFNDKAYGAGAATGIRFGLGF